MHCIRLNWGLVRFGKWGRERIQKSYVDMQLMINIQLTWKQGNFIQVSSHFPPCASVTPVTPCCNYLSCWDHVSSLFIFSEILYLAACLLKIHWIKLAFQVSGRNDLSVLYLPGFLSILLYFFSLFLSLSGFSHWMSEFPGPLHHGQPGWGPGLWPGPVDLQRGGCGHWEGGCLAPTHPAAFSALPCECLPPFPKIPYALDWLYVILDSSWVIKIILIWPLPVSVFATYMGYFPD